MCPRPAEKVINFGRTQTVTTTIYTSVTINLRCQKKTVDAHHTASLTLAPQWGLPSNKIHTVYLPGSLNLGLSLHPSLALTECLHLMVIKIVTLQHVLLNSHAI